MVFFFGWYEESWKWKSRNFRKLKLRRGTTTWRWSAKSRSSSATRTKYRQCSRNYSRPNERSDGNLPPMIPALFFPAPKVVDACAPGRPTDSSSSHTCSLLCMFFDCFYWPGTCSGSPCDQVRGFLFLFFIFCFLTLLFIIIILFCINSLYFYYTLIVFYSFFIFLCSPIGWYIYLIVFFSIFHFINIFFLFLFIFSFFFYFSDVAF